MVAISVPKLSRKRWQQNENRDKRNINTRKQIMKNEHKNTVDREPVIIKHKLHVERKSRNTYKLNNVRSRDKSIPCRNKKCCFERMKVRAITEINNQTWIEPFI